MTARNNHHESDSDYDDKNEFEFFRNFHPQPQSFSHGIFNGILPIKEPQKRNVPIENVKVIRQDYFGPNLDLYSAKNGAFDCINDLPEPIKPNDGKRVKDIINDEEDFQIPKEKIKRPSTVGIGIRKKTFKKDEVGTRKIVKLKKTV